MQNRIVVKNLAQVVLYECEIKGQLSDGNWENSSPWQHYKPWCNAKAEVGEPIGVNFYSNKNNYGLHTLIQYVGERMQFMGALATLFPDEAKKLMAFEYGRVPESVWEWNWYTEQASKSELPDYYSKVLDRWEKAGLTIEKIELVGRQQDYIYPMKQLRKDLTSIKKAMKVKN